MCCIVDKKRGPSLRCIARLRVRRRLAEGEGEPREGEESEESEVSDDEESVREVDDDDCEDGGDEKLCEEVERPGESKDSSGRVPKSDFWSGVR